MKTIVTQRAWAPTLLVLLTLSLFAACEKDDTDFSDYIAQADRSTDDATDPDGDDSSEQTLSDTLFVAYSGNSATVTGDKASLASVSGADVTINDLASTDALVLVLSGSTTDGSLLVYRQRQYCIVLNGVSIANADGPAINNQCSKALYVECPEGTVNTLTDGTAYAARDFDQKGAFFSEGQTYFSGSGALTVNGNYKNAIACDDYITIEGDIVITASTAATGTNGVKVNDGLFINGGTLRIDVASAGGRGIRCEARTTITDGDVTISTTGDCKVEETDGVRDTTSAACIKCDSLFTMTGGTLTMTSSGDGGKGINCSGDIVVSGGTFVAKTTGSNDVAKPKAVKSDTAIIVSGGSFSASVKKSWACDNGTDSEEPADRLTIKGTPATLSLAKKSVTVVF